MLRRLLAWCLVVALGLVAVGGCTGSREKGKNKDYDRPRSPDTRR